MTEPQTIESTTFTDLDILHLTCCDEGIAFCGEDVSQHPWDTEGELCPLCELVDKEELPCPVPGCPIKPGGFYERIYDE